MAQMGSAGGPKTLSLMGGEADMPCVRPNLANDPKRR